MTELVLRPLTVADEKVAWAAHGELEADDFDFLLNLVDGEPWGDYVARLARWRDGVGVPEDLVPAAFLVADVGGEIVGRSSIRFRLNDYLAERGGHIGYGVRPAYRGRGYATDILRASLAVIGDAGVRRVLVTCDDGNAASAAVIERCGGVLEDVRVLGDGARVRRYWIDVPAAPA